MLAVTVSMLGVILMCNVRSLRLLIMNAITECFQTLRGHVLHQLVQSNFSRQDDVLLTSPRQRYRSHVLA